MHKNTRNHGRGNKHHQRMAIGLCALLGAISLTASLATYAIEPRAGGGAGIELNARSSADSAVTSNVGGRGFAARGVREDQSEIKVADKVAIRASFATESMPAQIAQGIGDLQYSLSPPNNLDLLMSSYQSQGLKMNRLNATWESERGTLTVGDDWSNFENFPRTTAHGNTSSLDEPHTAKQIAWASRSGFSIAIEEPNIEEVESAADTDLQSLQTLTAGPPNLVLSWQGELAPQGGQYKLSVLGRKLEVEGVHNDVAVDDSKLGWGLNLGGGWRFGDLFAALNVTLGKGIDSLILKRFGRDVAVSPSGQTKTTKSFRILPSLNYSIGQHSDFHVTLGHYQSLQDDVSTHGIHTLDTINLGYTWSPWPSAKFEVEVIGKDFEGTTHEQDSTEIKIGAQKSF